RSRRACRRAGRRPRARCRYRPPRDERRAARVTGGERSRVGDGSGRPDRPMQVVVVAADAARLTQYTAALRRAGAPPLGTLDADEAEALLAEHRPGVLVLDRGLPRLALFR